MKKNFTLVFFLVLFLLPGFSKSQNPVSLGAAPNEEFKPWSINSDGPYSRAFVYTGTSSFQLNKHFVSNTILTPIGPPVSVAFPGAAAVDPLTGYYYVVEQTTPWRMFRVDSATGSMTFLFNCTGVPLGNLTGIAWSPSNSTMYAVATNITQSQIFTINMTNGVCTTIGTPSSTCAGAIAIAAPATGNSLFVIDIVADNLYKANRVTGVFSLVGPLGVNANFGQDATFDLSDNKLYWAAYTTGSQLRLLDTATVNSVLIGTYAAQVATIGIYGRIVGINDNTSIDGINIYPNPSTNFVSIKAPVIESIKIFNTAGQLIEDKKVNSDDALINVSGFDAGLYILQIKTNKGCFFKRIAVCR
jgi:hypothetical protein